jgi:GTP-binding protein Era
VTEAPPGGGVPTRFAYVAILGAPNAGKSTLINRLVGAKIAIVTPKAQTTRRRLLGIASAEGAQLVFIDTPGIFVPRGRFDRAMVHDAWRSAVDADLIVVLVDASKRSPDQGTRLIVDGLKKRRRKAILALNKVDAAKRENLLTFASELHEIGIFSDVFMISGRTGDGVDDLKAKLTSLAPAGPWHFPADQLADAQTRFLAAEATREQLFLQLEQELPYALTVEPESWEDFADGSVRIGQVILVERDSQKAIILGKGGRRIKEVREAAQASMGELMGRKVHLFLQVVVRNKWQEDPERYLALGLDYEA